MKALAPLDDVRETEKLAFLVVDHDVDDLRVEDLLELVADEVVDRLRVELARDRRLDAVDQGQLGVPLPRLVHQPRVLQRDAEAAGKGYQEPLVVLAEGMGAVDVLERDHSGRAPAHDEGDEERRFGLLPGQRLRVAVALGKPGPALLDQQRLPRLHHVLAEADQLDRLVGEADAALDRVGEVDEAGRVVVDPDVDDLGVEHLLEPVADEVVDRLRIELTGDRRLHAVDQRQLGVPLPRLVHQPRVLERHAQTAGKRLEQLLVRLTEGVLPADVLERDHARRGPRDDERNEEHGLRVLTPLDGLAAVRLGDLGDVLGDEQRAPCVQHMLRETAWRPRLFVEPLAPFDQVPVVQEPGRRLQHRDPEDLRVEDPLDPVADGVVDRLRVELARDRVLHAVDQRQLGVPLPRLVHQPRVLERHAQAAGQRLEQLLVRLAEGVLAVDVLQSDHACGGAAGHERNEQDRLRALAGRDAASVSLGLGVHVLHEQQRLARLQHVLRETAQRGRLRLQPLTALEDVRVMQKPGRPFERPDRDHLRVEDLLDLVADGVVDRLRVELAGDRVLHAVDQRQLGVPLPRLVHQSRVLERHAQAAAERRQQADVVLGEGIRPVEVLQRDPAADVFGGAQRNEQHRMRRLSLSDRLLRTALGEPGIRVIDEDRGLRREELPCRERALEGGRLVRKANATLERVHITREPGREVENGYVDDLGVEDLLDLVADYVVDRLQLELAGERLLDAVDQRQLGVPLPRLVHQPRVLERNAEAAGERLQELLVGVRESMLPVDVLERDHARCLAAGDEWHVEHRLRHLALQDRVAVSLGDFLEVLVDA